MTEQLNAANELIAQLRSDKEQSDHITTIQQKQIERLLEARDIETLRAEKAEKAVAEMRSLIEWKCDCPAYNGEHDQCCINRYHAAEAHALSSTHGQGYVSREELKPTIKLLDLLDKWFRLKIELGAIPTSQCGWERDRLQKLMEEKPSRT